MNSVPEGLRRIFSGKVSLARLNGFGIALLAAGLALCITASGIAGRCPENRREGCRMLLKLAAVVLCAAGAMIAILV